MWGVTSRIEELTIEFDRECCVWKFKKAETELWKQPPNPLLEAINNFLTEDKPEWEGTATELVSQLPDMQIQANVLSRKLNVVNSQLLNNYGIFYDNKRGHERKIVLKRLSRESKSDDMRRLRRYFLQWAGIENIDAIDANRRRKD